LRHGLPPGEARRLAAPPMEGSRVSVSPMRSDADRVGSSAAPILAFDGVIKRYGTLEALSGVSFQVNRGEVVCLIGPSGSGKSTLLRCANALEGIDGGRVVFDGVDVQDKQSDVRKLRRRMGMVFQNFELFPHLTVLRN